MVPAVDGAAMTSWLKPIISAESMAPQCQAKESWRLRK
jgi:hypothetical protein